MIAVGCQRAFAARTAVTSFERHLVADIFCWNPTLLYRHLGSVDFCALSRPRKPLNSSALSLIYWNQTTQYWPNLSIQCPWIEYKLIKSSNVIKLLHKNTNSLTYNQLAIESTRRLVLSIIKEECKGLKDFFEVISVPQGKELRPKVNQPLHGRLPVPLKEEWPDAALENKELYYGTTLMKKLLKCPSCCYIIIHNHNSNCCN
jgi:hypothetical protein